MSDTEAIEADDPLQIDSVRSSSIAERAHSRREISATRQISFQISHAHLAGHLQTGSPGL